MDEIKEICKLTEDYKRLEYIKEQLDPEGDLIVQKLYIDNKFEESITTVKNKIDYNLLNISMQ